MKNRFTYFTFCAALLGSTFCCASLSAMILLDDVMSKDKQKQTGVYNLSAQEKFALEKWLNDNFVLKTDAEKMYASTTLTLSMNINQGERLELSDGSLWEISPDDRNKSAAWITPFPIQISPSNNADYPFILENKNNHESVKARKVVASTAPTPPAPATPSKQPAAQ